MHFLSIAGEAYPYRLGQFMLHAGPAPAACGRGRAIRLYARIGRPVSVRLRWLHLSPPRATATLAARPVHIAAIPAGNIQRVWPGLVVYCALPGSFLSLPSVSYRQVKAQWIMQFTGLFNT
jgi:hypothetical protein